MGAMIIGGSECMGRTCRGLCAKYSIMSWRASVFSAVHACSSVQADRMLQQLPLLD